MIKTSNGVFDIDVEDCWIGIITWHSHDLKEK